MNNEKECFFRHENTILEKLFEFARSVPDFRRSNKGNIGNLTDWTKNWANARK